MSESESTKPRWADQITRERLSRTALTVKAKENTVGILILMPLILLAASPNVTVSVCCTEDEYEEYLLITGDTELLDKLERDWFEYE